MEHRAELLHTSFVTHDVKRFVTTRPDGLEHRPGQGVEVAIATEEWENEGRPFTPTGHLDDRVLEFMIKEYPERDAVTHALHGLRPGATWLMSDAFGTITYRGPGTFLAGGAGITPFLAILRNLDGAERERCTLHFSNLTPADVICEKELRWLLGERCRLTCTRESGPGYDDRRIDRAYLEDVMESPWGRVYLCGPPTFVETLQATLGELGVEETAIVVEE